MRNRTFKYKVPAQKYEITQEEIDKVKEDAASAEQVLENIAFMNYLNQAKSEILDITAKQLLSDSKEEVDVNGTKKTMYFSASKEYNILAGQYRFIEQIISDLRSSISTRELLNEKIASNEVTIRSDPVEIENVDNT